MKPGTFMGFCSLLLTLGGVGIGDTAPCLASALLKGGIFHTDGNTHGQMWNVECGMWNVECGNRKSEIRNPKSVRVAFCPWEEQVLTEEKEPGGFISEDAVRTVLDEALSNEARTMPRTSTYHVLKVFPESDFIEMVLFPTTADDLIVPSPPPIVSPSLSSDVRVADASDVRVAGEMTSAPAPPPESRPVPEIPRAAPAMSRALAPSELLSLPETLDGAVLVDTVMPQWYEQQTEMSPSPNPFHQGRGTIRMFLVDVREKRQFAHVRIPGSLNIPLFAIKTKGFLKGKPLVLVDAGYRPRQLAEACEQLRQAGFDARFLFGGLNAWRTWSAQQKWASPPGWRPSGSLPRSANVNLLPLQGDVFAQKTLNRMPPQALFAEQEGKYWLIIDVSAGDVSPGIFSRSISVPFDRNNPEQFLADVERTVEDAPRWSDVFLVLIYNQYGEDYEAIERVLQNTRIAPVFFLEGGFVAYTRFVAQQTQIKQGQHQELTTTCTSCPR